MRIAVTITAAGTHEEASPLSRRGEASAASANPQATSRLGVFTCENNLGSIVDPAVCFLDVKRFLETIGE